MAPSGVDDLAVAFYIFKRYKRKSRTVSPGIHNLREVEIAGSADAVEPNGKPH
jgi:hypothetical protein